ncbi:MAG: hypothetical protein AB7S26_06640 [Sandaracinaceae bacterium]
MRLFSTDPDVPGVFAVGQVAVGIFAFGQLAVGVVAIGQVARGVFALGQLAIGFVAVGQGALGVLYAGGMGAIGGRGFGLCLKMLPKMVIDRFERPTLPPVSSLAEALEKGRGWVVARIKEGRFVIDGTPFEPELAEDARRELARAVAQQHNHALLTLRTEDRVEASDGGYRDPVGRSKVAIVARLSSWVERAPELRLEGPLTSIGGLILRGIGMIGLVIAWYFIAGQEILAMFK